LIIQKEWTSIISKMYPGKIMLSRDYTQPKPSENLLDDFTEYGFIRDDNDFSAFRPGDRVRINITVIDSIKEIERLRIGNHSKSSDDSVQWHVEVSELGSRGFCGKDLKSKGLFSRHRTEAYDDTWLDNGIDRYSNPFEVGDIVRITIQRISPRP
jgi:ribosomal protein L21E